MLVSNYLALTQLVNIFIVGRLRPPTLYSKYICIHAIVSASSSFSMLLTCQLGFSFSTLPLAEEAVDEFISSTGIHPMVLNS